MDLEQITEILYEQSLLLRYGPKGTDKCMLVATNWLPHFVNVSLSDFQQAFLIWTSGNSDFPTPKDILEKVKEVQDERARTAVQIPDNLRSFEEQAEINRKGIAAVRAALKNGRGNLKV